MAKENKKVEEPLEKYGQPLNFEKVWLMFQETDKKFKETDKKFQATDRKFQETERFIKEQSKETDKKMKELQNLFTTQWGKLMETLVEGDLIKLLNKRGIEVHRTWQRASGSFNGNPYEFDIVALNGKEAVIVEVKTTLRVDDVKNFLKKLSKVKLWMKELEDKDIFGAVAYLTANSSSHILAANKGLFVIRATGNSASIINKEDFKPQKF